MELGRVCQVLCSIFSRTVAAIPMVRTRRGRVEAVLQTTSHRTTPMTVAVPKPIRF